MELLTNCTGLLTNLHILQNNSECTKSGLVEPTLSNAAGKSFLNEFLVENRVGLAHQVSQNIETKILNLSQFFQSTHIIHYR